MRGDLRTYKIHLGSGNVILSKALLLAADRAVSDPSITRQIAT